MTIFGNHIKSNIFHFKSSLIKQKGLKSLYKAIVTTHSQKLNFAEKKTISTSNNPKNSPKHNKTHLYIIFSRKELICGCTLFNKCTNAKV